jgi:sugar phosphate isomerase/epimerase
MLFTLHAISTFYSNALTDIRLASETGFEGYEILETKLLRFLDQGYPIEDLKAALERYRVTPVCINALKNVERVLPEERKQLLKEAERLCSAAEAAGFQTIQLLPLCGLQGRPWQEVLELTAHNVAEIADIGREHGVRFQLEPVAWSPIHSLSQALAVIRAAGRDNVGLVVDFWHLWAKGKTDPAEVARLDSRLIYGIHFCDGKKPENPDEAWDELALRSYLPGEGDIPIAEWVAAVKATGYDGSWSSELISPRHWEWDLVEIAHRTRTLMEAYVNR